MHMRRKKERVGRVVGNLVICNLRQKFQKLQKKKIGRELFQTPFPTLDSSVLYSD